MEFLRRLYDVTEGSTSKAVQMHEVGRDLGLDEDTTGRIVEWLCDRGLTAWFAFGGMITITTAGVDAAEAAAGTQPTESAATAAKVGGDEFAFDLFISHASEDKEKFVRPLVQALEARELKVWFDEAQVEVGDSLMEKIEEGLRRSRFGAVVLSPAFFGKNWPRAELNALANRELSTGERVVLPIWLDVEVKTSANTRRCLPTASRSEPVTDWAR
jgi:TIR domain